MTIKLLTVALFSFVFTLSAHADCEQSLRGIEVDSGFIMGQKWDSIYFNITNHALGAKSVVQVKYANCEDDACKQKLDLIENANWKHQLLKFSVDAQTCSNLWNYFIQINGGGTADFLDIRQLKTVDVDFHYPF
jgi:hypothetical protein